MTDPTYRSNSAQGSDLEKTDNPILSSADHIEPRKDMQIKALIRSGDYFDVLATEMDRISSGMSQNDPIFIDLQRLARELLYVQTQYEIIEK